MLTAGDEDGTANASAAPCWQQVGPRPKDLLVTW